MANQTSAPGDYGQPTLSPLFIDGMSLDQLTEIYDDYRRASQRNAETGRFWATPPRPSTATSRDVIEVALSTPKWVNQISFRLSNFPCRAWLQALDDQTKQWMPVLADKGGRPVQITILNSIPALVSESVSTPAHLHPQHQGAGHWRTFDIKTRKIKASRFRLVLAHIPSDYGPRDRYGRPVDYSLAVRDFQVGHKITRITDAPRPPIPTQFADKATPFAASQDLLGSAVDFSIRQYRASDILWPAKAAIAGQPKDERVDGKAVWRCEPQPLPYAVVNLYLDARDKQGASQSVNRFFIDPLTAGVNVNLYYSNDEPSGDFTASDEPIRFPSVRETGSVRATASGLVFDDTNAGFLDIDSGLVQWRSLQPWWMGVAFQTQFSSDDTSTWVIMDSPGLTVRWVNQTLEITVNGAVAVRDGLSFDFNETLQLAVAWDGTHAWFSMADGWVGGSTPTNPQANPADPAEADLIRIGGMRAGDGNDPGLANVRLLGLVLKQEAIDLSGGGLPWGDQALSDYVVRPAMDDPSEDHTANTILRYSPAFQTLGTYATSPFGLVGGPGDRYADLEWVPINRDFRLRKGVLKFDAVLAKYFKFEFTNLVPEPYASIEPVLRRVRMFSPATVQESLGVRTVQGSASSLSVVGGSGATLNQALGSQIWYSDETRVIYKVNPDRSYPDFTPTEALYARDPQAQDRLSSLSPIYSFQPWHQSTSAPRFVQTGRHSYQYADVLHRSKVAYFVGLKQVRMYRANYGAAEDTDEYRFDFHDRSLLDDTLDLFPWDTDSPYGLVSPGELTTGYCCTTSEVLNSRRNVRGVQFAATQTPPQQMLTDPDFNLGSLRYWSAFGDALVEPTDDLNSDIGTTVKVTRFADDGGTGSQSMHWSRLEQEWSSWDAIEESNPDPNMPTWNDLLADAAQTQAEGGVQSLEYVQPPARGRLYAAARVYAPQALEQPLRLQIISETHDVLAEGMVSVNAGQISEWYVGYTIGEGGAPPDGARTFDDIEALGDWDQVEAVGTWDEVFNGPPSEYTGTVSVRLIQDQATNDEYYVDNISLFEDPIVWEFSNDDGQSWYPAYDIRNNPHGVLLFPDVASETIAITQGTNLRWRVSGYRDNLHVSALVIRPWYSSLSLGVLPSLGIEHGGPNQTPYDHFPAVEDSPPFKAWDRPIPEEWFFSTRQWLLQQHPVTLPKHPVAVEAIAPVDEGSPLAFTGPYLAPDTLFYNTSPSTGAYLFDGFVVPKEQT